MTTTQPLRYTRRLGLLCCGFLALGVAFAGARGADAQTPSASEQRQAESSSAAAFVGGWQLDNERSEDAREKLRAAMEKARAEGRGRPSGGGPPGGGMPGGGTRGGPPGGTGGGRQPGGPPGGVRGSGPGATDALLDAPQSLTITGDTAELVLDDGEGYLVRLHLDNRYYEREGGALQSRARVEDGALVVESKTERGPKAKTTYRLLPGARELEVVTLLEGGPFGEGVSVRRVYVAAPRP